MRNGLHTLGSRFKLGWQFLLLPLLDDGRSISLQACLAAARFCNGTKERRDSPYSSLRAASGTLPKERMERALVSILATP
jgi:hypothetical protein